MLAITIHRRSSSPLTSPTHLSSILLARSSSALLHFSFLDSCRSFLTLHSLSIHRVWGTLPSLISHSPPGLHRITH
jgi:hypothetical protein